MKTIIIISTIFFAFALSQAPVVNVNGIIWIDTPCAFNNASYTTCGGTTGCPSGSTACSVANPTTGVVCDTDHCIVAINGLPAYQSTYTCTEFARDVGLMFNVTTLSFVGLQCSAIRCPYTPARGPYCSIRTK